MYTMLRQKGFSDVTVSASFSIGGSGSSGKKPPVDQCAGDNWYLCSDIVTYFTSPSGSGYSKLNPIIKEGTWDQVQLAVVDALQDLGMLNASYGWDNVKYQIYAMTFFLSRNRVKGKDMRFDSTLDALTASAAYAWDRALEMVAAAQSKQQSVATAVTLSPFAAQKASAAKISDQVLASLQSIPPPQQAMSAPMSLQLGSSTNWIVVGAVVLLAAGGGFYFYKKRKAA